MPNIFMVTGFIENCITTIVLQFCLIKHNNSTLRFVCEISLVSYENSYMYTQVAYKKI